MRGTEVVNAGERADPGARAALFTLFPLRHNDAASADAMLPAPHRHHTSARRFGARAVLRNVAMDTADLAGSRRLAGDSTGAGIGKVRAVGCRLAALPA